MAIDFKVEMELSGRGNGWTDVSADVHLPSGVEGSRGIQGQGPRDLVASTGVLTFSLINSAANSGGLQGYYSPGHANVRSGFATGVWVRTSITIEGTEKFLWSGTITKIEPGTGKFLEQLTEVTARDYMDKLATHRISGLDVKTDRAEHDLFSDIIAEMSIQPRGLNVSDGPDTYSFAFDQVRDEGTVPLTELQRLAQSSLAHIYLTGIGILTYEPRTERALPEDPIFRVRESDLKVADRLVVDDNQPERLNKVQTVIAPRRTDGSTVVLARANQPVKIETGGPFQVKLLFTDPGQRAFRAGGINLVSPVANTDYVFNSAADGSGTDVTADVSVNATFSGNAVLLGITNNSGGTAYATTLQVRGEGVYAQEEMTFESSDDDAIAVVGENVETFEMPYQDDAPTARNVSEYLLHVFSQEERTVQRIPLMLDPSELNRAKLIRNREIGDRCAVTETVTALDETEFFIQAIDFEVRPDGTVWMFWTPKIADATDFWFLGVTGASELGQTTRLGFGLVVGHTDAAHSDSHADSAHSDTAHDDTHSDAAHGDSGHGDTGHTDTHDDTAHTDTHTDDAHGDVAHEDSAHGDSHGDVSHVDSHSDSAHSDTHTDDAHTDQHADVHGDHTDGIHQDNPYNDSHSDVSHGDTHSDVNHADSHSDTSHDDSHGDAAHSDSHTDDAHSDTHSDVNHADTHSDSAHTDAAHTDSAHSDTHTDTGHVDAEHGDSHGDEIHGDVNTLFLALLAGVIWRLLGGLM